MSQQDGSALKSEPSAFDNERYQNWRLIGEGGTALVYQVKDLRLECDVAIKVLKPAYAQHHRVLEGLRQEVLTSRRLRHPGITAIHDFYEGPAGIGVVMDWVQGQTLKQWELAHQDQRLHTLQQRLDLLIALFEAMMVAHRDVVHRDLKPANIMFLDVHATHPVIMDFGLALPLASASESRKEGTQKYAAPEQWKIIDAAVDKRTDLFSLGVMAYELFTGHLPVRSLIFMDTKTQTLNDAEWIPVTDYCQALSGAMDRLLKQMLAYNPNERPSSAEEVLALLRTMELADPDDIAPTTILERNVSLVPQGSFILGSGPESDNPTEKPRRRIQISAFELERAPVTNLQYQAYVDATGATHPPYMDDPQLGLPDHPVVGVKWSEARSYAQWKGGDLPTEAQWEYAARGGEKIIYPWGNASPGPMQANIGRANSGTSAVGSYPGGTNAFGLQDMCGNVSEWCLDPWDKDYYRSLSKGSLDPVAVAKTKEEPMERSLRGGGFDSFPTMGRCSARFQAKVSSRAKSIGFRVAYSVAPSSDGGADS